MTKTILLLGVTMIAACSAPAERASEVTASVADSCGWVDPGCNPHEAPATVDLCVTATGEAGVLPVGVSACDMEPGAELTVAPADSWNTWTRPGATDWNVSAAPCR